MLKTYSFAEGKLVSAPAETSQVFVYSEPDEAQRAYLVGQLLLDEHTLQSSLDPDELGRVEYEADHVAVIVKRPRRYCSADNFLLKVSSIGLFIFADKFIIVSADEFTFENRIFGKLRSVQDVFLRVIFTCIRHFEEHLTVIHSISDELEQDLNTSMSNKSLFNMFNLEKSLVYYLNAINSNSKVIEKLKNNAPKFGFSVETMEFLEDVIIENAQCYEQANTYSQVLSSLMDARASVINNNLSIRLKMLTIFSICIMMPTFVVSLFSMNVKLPFPQEGAIWPFWMAIGLALTSVVTILTIWRVRKW
jgi:magnesium transporter